MTAWLISELWAGPKTYGCRRKDVSGAGNRVARGRLKCVLYVIDFVSGSDYVTSSSRHNSACVMDLSP